MEFQAQTAQLEIEINERAGGISRAGQRFDFYVQARRRRRGRRLCGLRLDGRGGIGIPPRFPGR
jgi:hypothetical protein